MLFVMANACDLVWLRCAVLVCEGNADFDRGRQ